MYSRYVDKYNALLVRQGCEQCLPAWRCWTRDLKKLLHESDVPPWLRGYLPLIYIEDELAAIPGICICEGFETDSGEGWLPVWEL
ncbi:MAG: tRNA lysidine(34) synthetase TilS [Gammaproteobacteria bacterium]|nr:tRNA lysidine(34) synthetase TilS [Gammaproteobacteria bacterium]